MSALSRVWARVRAAAPKDWVRGEGVLPPAALASAELRAAELALSLDLSGGEVAGLAVDWPNCYGGVPLATVDAVARAARVLLAFGGRWSAAEALCRIAPWLKNALPSPVALPAAALPLGGGRGQPGRAANGTRGDKRAAPGPTAVPYTKCGGAHLREGSCAPRGAGQTAPSRTQASAKSSQPCHHRHTHTHTNLHKCAKRRTRNTPRHIHILQAKSMYQCKYARTTRSTHPTRTHAMIRGPQDVCATPIFAMRPAQSRLGNCQRVNDPPWKRSGSLRSSKILWDDQKGSNSEATPMASMTQHG